MRILKAAALAAALALHAIPGAVAHDYKAGALHIAHPWTRATPPNAAVAGGYMTIENGGGADRLVAASSPAAGEVQVHSMAMEEGIMRMRQLPDGLPLPAGEAVTLAPGGYHLMLIGLAAPLREGERVPLTLRFEKAGEIEVELAVEAMGAAAGHAGHGS